MSLQLKSEIEEKFSVLANMQESFSYYSMVKFALSLTPASASHQLPNMETCGAEAEAHQQTNSDSCSLKIFLSCGAKREFPSGKSSINV